MNSLLLSALDELEKKAKDIEGYRATDVYHDHHVGCCFVRDGCREESDYKCEKVADFIESANRETVLKLIETVRKMRLELEDMQDRGVTELFNELEEIWK